MENENLRPTNLRVIMLIFGRESKIILHGKATRQGILRGQSVGLCFSHNHTQGAPRVLAVPPRAAGAVSSIRKWHMCGDDG
jgi:hypothetical protein